jgi:hypothetical protein
MPTFWIALVALYLGFYKLGSFPGADRLDPGVTPRRTRPVSTRSTLCSTVTGGSSCRRCTTSSCPRSCLQPSISASSPATRGRPSSRWWATTTCVPRVRKVCPNAWSSRATSPRAALPAVVTVLGLVFANLLTGAVLVEKIFSWPGIGQYAYQAAVNLDVPRHRRRQPVRRRCLHGARGSRRARRGARRRSPDAFFLPRLCLARGSARARPGLGRYRSGQHDLLRRRSHSGRRAGRGRAGAAVN